MGTFAILLMLLGSAEAGLFGAEEETPAPEPVPEVPVQMAAPLFEGGLPVDIHDVPTGLANITAQGCNGCHYQAHADWEMSAHAGAGQNSSFQEALRRVGNSTACSQCHLPLKVQHATLAAGYIDGDLARPKMLKNAAWDPTLMAEGVGCAVCHVRDGHILAARPVTGAPHPISVSSELGSSEMCATCHQLSYPDSDRPFYDTYGEWKQTAHAQAGIRCQDCHMPPEAGTATATRFAAAPSHGLKADIARALTVLVELDSPEVERGKKYPVTVKLQNTGAGHHVPTGSPYKSYTVTVSLVDKAGKTLSSVHSEQLGRTVTEEAPYTTTADNRIPAGGEHEINTSFTVDHRKKPGDIRLEVSVGTTADPQLLQTIPLQLY